MSEYGYISESPAQSFGNNTGIFSPNDIYDLTRADKYTNYGQLELIETKTITSAVSTVDFDDLGNYNVHFLTINDGYNTTNGKGIAIRLYESGVLESSTVYQLAGQDCTPSFFAEDRGTTKNAFRFGNNTSTSDTQSNINGYLYFYNFLDSAKYSFVTQHFTGWSNSSEVQASFGSNVLPQASSVNKFQIMAYDVGTFTGSFSLYGIRYS
tara:strand:+ start:70 stop:699 length:630 start_codon:yes stop_codon:yes gene_type:complete